MSISFLKIKTILTISVATLFVLTACGGVAAKPAQPQEKVQVANQGKTSQQTGSAAEPAKAPAEVSLNTTKNTALGDILTDSQGMTLYTFKNDKPHESTCYDTCAQNWPPFVVAEGQKLILPKDVSGTLDTIKRNDGTYQVTYNDMPLYFFAKDTKPGETNGQNVNDVWHVASLNGTETTKEASAIPTQPGLQTNDEWIVAEKNVWLPVIDGLGQHLQMAHQHFEAQDYPAAATEIQAAANFLKDESTHITNPTSQEAIKAANAELEKLVTQVEEGKVTSIEELNTIFRDVYQTDIDHRVNGLSAEMRSSLAEQPGKHFQKAFTALNNNDNQTAATELQKGIAFAKIEASTATGQAKDSLTTAIADLETMAGQLAENQTIDGKVLEQLIARTHHALASHHIARSEEAQANNSLKEVGYELKTAAMQMELALSQTGHKVEGDNATHLEELRNVAGHLIKGDTLEMSRVTKAIEAAKQELATIDQMLTTEYAQIPPSESPQPVEAWIFADENTWIPVVDHITDEMQMAHQAFMDGDTATAAEHIRQSAGFFKERAANLKTEAAKTAFNTTAADLEKLADQVEQGKVKMIEDLTVTLLKAYDVDVEFHLAPASAEEYSPLVEWPITHLGRAKEAFDQGDTQKASEEIFKAISFLRLEEARATEPAHNALKNATDGLEQAARNLREGQTVSGKDLDKAFILAYHALGNHHYLRATAAFDREALKESGFEMQAAAQALHQIQAHNNGQSFKSTADLEKDLRDLSEKLLNGTTPEPGEVSRMLEKTGQEIQKIGQIIGVTDSTEWLQVQENTYIPVVDELGVHLQNARQNFEAGDMTAAATEIRQGAEFLQQEEMGPGSEEDIQARNAAAESLIKLADKIEQGQIKAAKELNTAFTEAYRMDVEHRLVHLTSEEVAHLVDKPTQHLDQAIEAFNNKDNQLAATEIRKALAFFDLDEARASGTAKDALKETMANLTTLAMQLDDKQPLKASDLEMAFTQAQHALASYHHSQAVEATDPIQAGYELQAATHDLEQALLRAGHPIKGDEATLINDLNTMANDMIEGKNIDSAQVTQTLERLGQKLEDLGQEIDTTMHMPSN